MADNVVVTPGTGATIAADEVADGTLGSVKVQFVKLMDGTLDGTSKAAVGANGLAVDVSASSGVGSLTEAAPASDTASSGLNGRLQRIAQNLTTAMGRAVAQLGARTIAQSPAVNLATDDLLVASTGTTTDAAATAGSTGTLQAKLRAISGQLLAGLPAQLGARTTAQSPAVNLATDDAQIGTKVTAISALASGGTGLIGWLSQIWNELATNGIKLFSQAYDVALTITRPANTTAYTANDNVGGALTFASMGPSAGAVMITGAQLELDIAAIPTGMTSFRLYLYSVTPPSAVADNGAFDLPSGDRASYLGYIDLGTPIDVGSTCYVEALNLNKQVKLAGTSLFGYLVTNGGFTPAANSEVYKVTLHAVAV